MLFIERDEFLGSFLTAKRIPRAVLNSLIVAVYFVFFWSSEGANMNLRQIANLYDKFTRVIHQLWN